MSMGHFACRAWTITWDYIKEMIPTDLVQVFEETLEDQDLTLDNFCREWQENGETSEPLTSAWERIVESFNHMTDLWVVPGWADPDGTGPYCDIRGGYFEVEGMEELTEAGKKLSNQASFSLWTQYG